MKFSDVLILTGVGFILGWSAYSNRASAAERTEQASIAERKAAIEACEGNGGIPVVVAGLLSSRGIACAEPLGN